MAPTSSSRSASSTGLLVFPLWLLFGRGGFKQKRYTGGGGCFLTFPNITKYLKSKVPSPRPVSQERLRFGTYSYQKCNFGKNLHCFLFFGVTNNATTLCVSRDDSPPWGYWAREQPHAKFWWIITYLLSRKAAATFTSPKNVSEGACFPMLFANIRHHSLFIICIGLKVKNPTLVQALHFSDWGRASFVCWAIICIFSLENCLLMSTFLVGILTFLYFLICKGSLFIRYISSGPFR